MRARRALLYMPGDDLHKITKAIRLGVDCICMDIEDGVALSRKIEARITIKKALQELDFHNAESLVRINSVGSGFEADDLSEILPAKPEGIVIPKVEFADQVRWVNDQISSIETRNNWLAGSICLMAIVETARGIINLPTISSSCERLEVLIFGAEDFAGDIGATRTTDGWEVFYARSAVVTHAAAYGLQAIDMVNNDFNDITRLKKEAIIGAQMAFAGKQVIHPNQVESVQEAFTPSDETIAYALQIIEDYKQHQDAGIGAFAIKGVLIDAPSIKIAERIVAIAKVAGKLPRKGDIL